MMCSFEIKPVTGEFPAQRASNAAMFPFDDVMLNQKNKAQQTRAHISCNI